MSERVRCAAPGQAPPYDEKGCSGSVWGVKRPGFLWRNIRTIADERHGELFAGMTQYIRWPTPEEQP